MGEIAEIMLDGTLCECCGEFLGDGDGFPGYCSRQCAEARGVLSCQGGKPESPPVRQWRSP